eukprot:CAMPEP_0175898830 /NCGR_PEP_ID=MMETSP0108-20121206/1464_1 /TAXON_ID=195067 ORGANISM="Goniomonas pacifica, Strain CCMP1869" /NCGR_SAMPLE_ID=MMETSP0108 /ASSEMBLY_ACC=CAM_ASM_000204 /LENGTH=120 /DNA_ID=CAMNT_0017220225 /DNA_START=212 /DNA_END=574 /DNA_ORIENTATION=+
MSSKHADARTVSLAHALTRFSEEMRSVFLSRDPEGPTVSTRHSEGVPRRGHVVDESHKLLLARSSFKGKHVDTTCRRFMAILGVCEERGAGQRQHEPNNCVCATRLSRDHTGDEDDLHKR